MKAFRADAATLSNSLGFAKRTSGVGPEALIVQMLRRYEAAGRLQSLHPVNQLMLVGG
jgi:hypothetical protein